MNSGSYAPERLANRTCYPVHDMTCSSSRGSYILQPITLDAPVKLQCFRYAPFVGPRTCHLLLRPRRTFKTPELAGQAALQQDSKRCNLPSNLPLLSDGSVDGSQTPGSYSLYFY